MLNLWVCKQSLNIVCCIALKMPAPNVFCSITSVVQMMSEHEFKKNYLMAI